MITSITTTTTAAKLSHLIFASPPSFARPKQLNCDRERERKAFSLVVRTCRSNVYQESNQLFVFLALIVLLPTNCICRVGVVVPVPCACVAV